MDGPPHIDIEVALLKQRSDHADQRMDRIEQKLDRVVDKLDTMNERLNSRLDGLATKTTVWSALGTGAALSFAVVAIFVGVLAYLQDQRIALRPDPPQASAPAPIILQLPPWPTAPTPPAPTAPPG